MVTSQLATSPAVARLLQWPATVARTLTGTLRFIADRASEEVGVSTGAGVTLLTTTGRRITSVATDPLADQLNALFDRHHENPAATAWFGHIVIGVRVGVGVGVGPGTIGSPEAERWPEWVEQAAAIGARSVLFAPLRTPQRLLGTLMVYSQNPDAYRRSDADMLDRYAGDAAILIDETQSAQTQFLRGTGAKR
ncbi:GAF domain-containing protein [Mycolicibacterium celeriflavum]|uniref:GAF domain-containing protein n=1 Tax=Mycolicibacterium celeriflavum TaxID=1249101 RepID=UPI003CE7CEEA